MASSRSGIYSGHFSLPSCVTRLVVESSSWPLLLACSSSLSSKPSALPSLLRMATLMQLMLSLLSSSYSMLPTSTSRFPSLTAVPWELTYLSAVLLSVLSLSSTPLRSCLSPSVPRVSPSSTSRYPSPSFSTNTLILLLSVCTPCFCVIDQLAHLLHLRLANISWKYYIVYCCWLLFELAFCYMCKYPILR